MRSRHTRRYSSGLLLALLCAAALTASLNAQVAGRNVNMVTGGSFPGGDPFEQKQNEPSIAVSTRNPCHLLAGANDYRAVQLEGLPADQEIGDAWLGWYESTDCGATWYSTLVPGYPQDQSPEGLASPAKGLGAGADPVVRSGAAGTFYYLFIAFNRGSNVGKLALARAIDHNDRDVFINPDSLVIDADGRNDRRRPLSPIKYVGTTEIARGSGGQFIDKPSLTVFPAATGTCTMDGETVPATNVYTAWTEFVGNSPENLRSKVYFARSADCGQTLAAPATKLSEGYPLGQGTVIAVNPKNPNDIYVIWRQIRNDRGKDALLFARSTDGGRSFTKADYVPGFGEGQFAPFDQNTTSTARGSSTTTFRTVAYPSLAFADDGFLYMAVSQVPGAPTGTLGGAQARITMTRTAGVTWEPPVEVADTGADGQQFMPALAYAAGRLQLIWYDVRFDEASTRRSDSLINEAAALAQEPKIRRTIDLVGAQASLAPSLWPPAFQPYGVSQPDYNEVVNGVRPLRGPRVSQYMTGDPLPNSPQGTGPRQLQFNRANLLLYGGGTIPFIGDYTDIGGTPFVYDGVTNRWVFNGLNNKNDASAASFHAAWTDNRDASVRNATTTNGKLDYSRPEPLPPNATIGDVSCPVVNGAEVDNTRTRDANVYTSRITNDFSLTLPTNSKPTNTPGVVRSFPVQLSNNQELTPGTKQPEVPTRFKLKLADLGASFSHRTFRGAPHAAAGAPGGCDVAPNQMPVQEIFVNVLPRSSVARTVYVRCGLNPRTRVVVTATRMILVDNPAPTPDAYVDGPTTSIAINPDPSNLAARGPDGSLLGPETHNPDAENPDAENPDAENPDAENPDAENPDAENPDAENPDAENPDAENPDAENTNYQDVSVDITNAGDTASGYQVQVQTSDSTSGYTFLLMGRRVTTTSTSINCHLVTKYTNQTLFAIPLDGADLTSGQLDDENAEDVKHPTFLVRPHESIRVTLRIVTEGAPDSSTQFCSRDPLSPDYCFNKLLFKSRAQAPNTGATEPEETTFGGVRSPNLSFVSQPTNATTTTTITSDGGPVMVTARDNTGAALPRVDITMSLGANPGDTSLTGTLTQRTNADGYATFDDLRLDRAGEGYILRASAANAESEDSEPFDITAGGAPSLVVVNTNASGAGSLYQAIANANANPGLDTITFNIPGTGVHTITPTATPTNTLLPLITDAVVIDAGSQPGYSGTPLVELDGSNFGGDTSAPGLAFVDGGSGSTVRGLAITGFGQSGIRLSNTSGVAVRSNWIGLDAATGRPEGNRIGILMFGATGTTIGGPIFGHGNTIGGNTFAGIAMRSFAASEIGMPSHDNLVQGNIIGVEPDSGGAPNGDPDSFGGGGVALSEGAYANRIGGTESRGSQNAIRGNIGAGVRIHLDAGVDNTVQYNRIAENTGLGIDLADEGVTANDALDADTGGNNGQNRPVMTGAFVSGETLIVSGTLNSEPGRYFVIDLHASASCTDGSRQGARWFGATILQADAAGNVVFNNVGFIGTNVAPGDFVTATATPTPDNSTFMPVGSTSEFSNCQVVNVP